MIELNKKYKLKRLVGLESYDRGEYTVIGCVTEKAVICENEQGERFVFLKAFLIDPEKPNETTIKIKLERK